MFCKLLIVLSSIVAETRESVCSKTIDDYTFTQIGLEIHCKFLDKLLLCFFFLFCTVCPFVSTIASFRILYFERIMKKLWFRKICFDMQVERKSLWFVLLERIIHQSTETVNWFLSPQSNSLETNEICGQF